LLRSEAGVSALDVLRNNLPAIDALGCACVHLHMAAQKGLSPAQMPDIERQALDTFAAGVELGARHGFRFGFEHNAPMTGRAHPFVGPDLCAEALAQVAGLSLVWDLNHTPAANVSDFEALIPRMSMLHVSDTPLPMTNAHLPIGMGNLDFQRHWRVLAAAGFAGPAILEIGGLPMSGGYGRDTDEALIESLRRLAL
jgi:L-ribulose-5-phosphate 3-epimerase